MREDVRQLAVHHVPAEIGARECRLLFEANGGKDDTERVLCIGTIAVEIDGGNSIVRIG
jgi:hypothetical protein